MKIVLGAFACCGAMAAAGAGLAQAIGGAGPPPQALAGYATSKAAAPYSVNQTSGYGSAGGVYSATAMSGYAGARAPPAQRLGADPVVGGPQDADPLASINSLKGARPAQTIAVTDARGAVWVFDPTLNGWRSRATAAVRFSQPRTGTPGPDAGRPGWLTNPDRPN